MAPPAEKCDALKKSFAKFDPAGSGKLPHDAIALVLKKLDDAFQMEEIERLLGPFNSNGEVNYMTFLDFLFTDASTTALAVPETTALAVPETTTALAVPETSTALTVPETAAVAAAESAESDVPTTNTGRSRKRMSNCDEAELRRIFEMCDASDDGAINKRELIKALRKHEEVAEFFRLPSHIRQEDGSRDAMEAFFQGADTNDDREMSWEELKAFWLSKHGSGPVHVDTGSAEPSNAVEDKDLAIEGQNLALPAPETTAALALPAPETTPALEN